jgi:hypothetical protein
MRGNSRPRRADLPWRGVADVAVEPEGEQRVHFVAVAVKPVISPLKQY